MRGKTYTIEDKNRVKKLILKKKSYKDIERILNVPKSTISTWFGKTIDKPWQRKTMLEHLSGIRILAIAALKNKWQKKKEEETKLLKNKIEKELTKYPFKNEGFYKSLLAMLYWAEGSKYEKVSGLQFTNTDPKLALLYITLLRKCYNVDENKFRVKLHLHYYHSIKKIKGFWSDTLRVPLKQFNKIYIKKRSKTKKFRKNFAGICFINYGNSDIRKELLEIGFALQKNIINICPHSSMDRV